MGSVLSVLALGGCSSSSPSGGSNSSGGAGAAGAAGAPGQEEPTELVQSALIIADEGGELALNDGTLLNLPPNVLADDTRVTLRRETCGGVYASSFFESCRYGVEAPGAELMGRFTLSLPTKSTPGSFSGCPAQLADDGFRCLVEADAEANALTTTATVLTSYAVHSNPTELPDQRVADVPLKPCGGDVVGDWTMVATTGTRRQVTNVDFSGPEPYAVCDEYDYYRSYPFRVAGSLSFAEGGCDADAGDSCEGAWQRSDSAEILHHVIATDGCLETVGETCHPDCSHENGLCECVWPKSTGFGGGGGYWGHADDQTLNLDGNEQPYCVEGNTLTLLRGEGEESYVVIYERD